MDSNLTKSTQPVYLLTSSQKWQEYMSRCSSDGLQLQSRDSLTKLERDSRTAWLLSTPEVDNRSERD